MASSATDAEVWLRRVLASRALGENAIRSALRAARFAVDDAQVALLLRRCFVQLSDGRWAVGQESGPPSPVTSAVTVRSTQSVIHAGDHASSVCLSLTGLVELLRASRQLVEASLYYLQRSSPNSDWPAIRKALRAGDVVELTSLQLDEFTTTVERFRSEFSTSASVKVDLGTKPGMGDPATAHGGMNPPHSGAGASAAPAIPPGHPAGQTSVGASREFGGGLAAVERALAEERARADQAERDLQEEVRRRQEAESASRTREEELRELRAQRERSEHEITWAKKEAQQLRRRLEGSPHADASEVARLRKRLGETENEVFRLEGLARASSEALANKMAKDRSARIAAPTVNQEVPQDSAPQSATQSAAKPRRWEQSEGGGYFYPAGEPTTYGEEQLFAQSWPTGWLVVGSIMISQGSRAREVDVLAITPRGIVVIEQKDTSSSGDIWFPSNGPPTVDGAEITDLDGALQQARLPAQMLASLCKDNGAIPGFIESVLSIQGQVVFTQTSQNQIHLSHTNQVVETVEKVHARRSERLASATVEWLLPSLGIPLDGLPSWTELGYAE